MDIKTAKQSIGKQFKVIDITNNFDVIREVLDDGTVVGDFSECHCSDARLKQEQPKQLKKQKNVQ
jgi:hypothetical protein